MQQYQVPQFITVEDKVIGPLTAKQFIYLAAGAVIIVLARILLIPIFFYPVALVAASFALGLAFLKINEQPFPMVVKNTLNYLTRPRLYVWKKQVKKESKQQEAAKPEVMISTTPRLSQSKLSDLAWSLNIKEKYRAPGDREQEDAPPPPAHF